LFIRERQRENESEFCGNGMIRVNKIFGTERGWGKEERVGDV
jgi:hypothetical protein